MNKVCLVKVVIATGIDMVTNEETTLLAAVCDEGMDRKAILQYMNNRGREIGVYVCDFKEVGPMPKWEVSSVLMSFGITSDYAVEV